MTNRAWIKLKVAASALSTVLFFQPSISFSANAECGDAVKKLDLSETFSLETQSIDQKIQNLAELKLSLDLAKVNGTSDIDVTAMKVHYEIKEQELLGYLTKNKIMTRNELIGEMKKKIARLQNQNNIDQKIDSRAREEATKRKEEQEREIKENVVDGARAIFHKVTPGDFIMGESDGQRPVTLTKIPEIMATKTTQIIYKTIADLANRRWPTKYQIEADPSDSKRKGDRRPVVDVSYEDAQKWTEALNDLSDAGEPALQDLIPSHKEGMKYGAFMTEAQREYVMKRAKTEDGDSIDDMIKREDFIKLKEYAVFDGSGQTADVDSKKPLFIDGKPFYDLVGNVWEWTEDSWDGSAPLIGGKDPISRVGSTRVIRGGSWLNAIQFMRSAYRGPFSPPGDRSFNIGFRFVRIVE